MIVVVVAVVVFCTPPVMLSRQLFVCLFVCLFVSDFCELLIRWYQERVCLKRNSCAGT